MTATADVSTRAKKAPRTEGERFALQLEITNLVLVLVAAAGCHLAFGPGPRLWGALVGGLIGAANLRAMVFLGRRIMASGGNAEAQKGKLKYVILFALKLGVLCTVVWLALANLPIDSIGFLIGFSTLLPAMLIATALRSIDKGPTTGERRQ
ncbi:MAG: ATP synthase subunit I [Myxococcota bacterium]